MQLTLLDWSIIVFFLLLSLGIGIWVSRRSGKSSLEFFLSGRNMPWWLLGMSMVATTFSTDTPNLVTDLVRQEGVSGNWVWWAFLLTGMLTVFIYAQLWRRSGVMTDMEFYELRYSGPAARFLRGFRAVYLGLFFNVLAMAAVCLAGIKIGEILFGIDKYQTILIAGSVTMVFSALGGFRGVLYTDLILFFLAISGAVAAAFYVVGLPEVGGLDALLAHDNVAGKLAFVPSFDDRELLITLLIIPLAVQWWSSWYPGAEPGGGGYVAQRMLAAKNERHAMGATFFFNVLHYAVRPWPWILVALASLVVFPDLDSIRAAFPGVPEDKIGHDLAYPAMLSFLPAGLLGWVMASLIAAFMSTLSTHLNWGASYLVHDVYHRFMRPLAGEKELVWAGRMATVTLMVLTALFAFSLQNAKQIFDITLMFGAGTGLIFILRWFWWRINAWCEIIAMIASGIVSIGFAFWGWYPDEWPLYLRYPVVIGITTVVWLLTMVLTRRTSRTVLFSFLEKIQPGGPGWSRIYRESGVPRPAGRWFVIDGLLLMLAGSVLVYSVLISTGYWLYGEYLPAIVFTLLAAGMAWALIRWRLKKPTATS
jgi:solute:Na+ symporter, SSS family